MAACAVGGGCGVRLAGLDPHRTGWVAGIDRDGRLDPEYEVRGFLFGRRGELRGLGPVLEFRDREAACRFLGGFQTDRSAMAALRLVLSAEPEGYAIGRSRDDQVLGLLAGCLVTRSVVVAVELGARPTRVVAPSGSLVETQEPSPAVLPPPPGGRREPPRHAATASDPLLPDRAGVGCDCLRGAAESGMPFILAGAR
jgi:hypothetical protein